MFFMYLCSTSKRSGGHIQFHPDKTQALLNSNNTHKHKVLHISGFLSHKHFHQNKDISEADEEELVTSQFLEELSRGGFRVPTLNMVHLVFSAFHLYKQRDSSRRSCTKYFRSLILYVDSPYSSDTAICKSLTNVIFKAEVLRELMSATFKVLKFLKILENLFVSLKNVRDI